MKRSFATVAFVVLLLAGCASDGPMRVTDAGLPRALPTGSNVEVHWGDPALFTELRYSRNRREAAEGDWVRQLAAYLQSRTERALPAGERVDIEILDVARAGDYEWLHGSAEDIRVLRDIHPPRMDLQFTRYDANGAVLAEGERTLSDLAYLMGSQPLGSNDPLRFEKRMIDRWVQREFGSRTR
jgi:hypothetical protein